MDVSRTVPNTGIAFMSQVLEQSTMFVALVLDGCVSQGVELHSAPVKFQSQEVPVCSL